MSDRAAFEITWERPAGIKGWLGEVNNQPVGMRFMLAALVFFLLAGVLALFMRVQLAVPDNDVLGPQVFNEMFTMHGATMMFLVMVPFLEGLAIYLLPRMIGSREMAFPRVSAFGFWVFLAGGLIFYSSFLFDRVPDGGWFVYPPLSLDRFSGKGIDFLLVGLGFIEIAGIATGIEIVVTILKLRGPGMTLARMPLFAWVWLVTGVMIIFAFATLLSATVLLELDRSAGTRFFDPTGGGNVLLWQHLFWFFGHPDVYIIFIPATGMVSMIVATFARRALAGYSIVVVAVLLTGFLSFGLWAHHMFATGLPPIAKAFFGAASLMIAIASGVQVFAWIATLWGRRPEIRVPLLFILGFLFLFVLGGMTGVMVAVVPFDLQVHDTYFVVAHFHYVLIGGVLFPIMAAIHYWMPILTGRMASERLGRWSFWLVFVGFNVTFFPMHMMGFLGMPRRVYTYPEDMGVGGLNYLSTVGSFVLGIGVLVLLVNFFWSRRSGPLAPPNPWRAGSLEWDGPMGPTNYASLKPPVVYSREPLWDPPAPAERDERLESVVRAMEAEPSRYRATLVTDAVTGEPQAIQRVSRPSYAPIATAGALFFVSVAILAEFYLLAALATAATVVLTVAWLYPREKDLLPIRQSDLGARTGLPLEPTGTASTGWWGLVGTLATLGTMFGVLFYSYFYIRIYAETWPQGDIALPSILWPAVVYGAMAASGGTLLLALRAFDAGRTGATLLLLGATGAMGVGFVVLALVELATAPFAMGDNAYASLFHVITWHAVLLAAGGVVFLGTAGWHVGRRGAVEEGYLVAHVQLATLFWAFAIVATLLVYATLYLSPHVF